MRAFSRSTLVPSVRRMMVAGLVATACVTGAAAHEFKAGALTIEHPWARATVPVAKVGGGYFTVVNSGSAADRLISVSVPPEVAARVEIHEMLMKDGVMSMREIPAGIEIPAAGKVALQPGKDGGAYHLMLMGLKAPLKEGSKFAGKLVFEKAGEVAVEFKVEGMAEKADAHATHGG